MKVGDLVRLAGNHLRPAVGVIVGLDQCGWFYILRSDNTFSLWPDSQMEIVNEKE